LRFQRRRAEFGFSGGLYGTRLGWNERSMLIFGDLSQSPYLGRMCTMRAGNAELIAGWQEYSISICAAFLFIVESWKLD
jgi:hypothetical protein